MEWRNLPIVAIHVADTLVGFFLLFLCWHRRTLPGAKRIMLLMGALLLWVVGSMVGALVLDPDARLVWASVECVGIAFTPVAYLLLAMEFNGGTFSLSRRAILLLLVVPSVFCLLTFTNPLHHLVWASVSSSRS